MAETASTISLLQRDLPYIEPFAAAAAFGAVEHSALLDSGGPIGPPGARYSYLCIDPFSIIEARAGTPSIDGAQANGEPLAALARLLNAHRFAPEPDGFAFRGGLAGYIGYETATRLDAIPAGAAEPDDPPDMFIACYDLVIGFDRERRICRVHSSGLPCIDDGMRSARAVARLDWASAELSRATAPAIATLPALRFQPDWSATAYRSKVARVLDYIAAGDIFQANLTMRHTARRPPGLDGRTVHAALRQANPAPFGAWLKCGPHELSCSSPERFIRLSAAGMIETSPIKGTIARESDPAADTTAQARLAGSAKDRAENVMIVDVLRNDLGRVAAPGSIAVPELCVVTSYATVHHLVSRITGRLRHGAGPIDLLRATLPGGSISGAPKIRAMQIIAEIETARRGIYCGCVVWMGYDGAMDSNIVIRSLVLTPDRVIAQSGGGIVADSDPQCEYAEMLLKAAPMLSIFPDAT